MPQISPMKWIVLNTITQSSIMQMISFLNFKFSYSRDMTNNKMLMNKMSWKW